MAAFFKAKDYGSRTQWEEGIVELQKAIKIYPNYTEAKALLGEFYFALQQYDNVISTLEACVNSADFPPRSVFLLSETYLKKAMVRKQKYMPKNI